MSIHTKLLKWRKVVLNARRAEIPVSSEPLGAL